MNAIPPPKTGLDIVILSACSLRKSLEPGPLHSCDSSKPQYEEVGSQISPQDNRNLSGEVVVHCHCILNHTPRLAGRRTYFPLPSHIPPPSTALIIIIPLGNLPRTCWYCNCPTSSQPSHSKPPPYPSLNPPRNKSTNNKNLLG